jgi:hypothetical protein
MTMKPIAGKLPVPALLRDLVWCINIVLHGRVLCSAGEEGEGSMSAACMRRVFDPVSTARRAGRQGWHPLDSEVLLAARHCSVGQDLVLVG